MSYDQLNARDGIVGLYPLVNTGAEKPLATLHGEENHAVAPHLDIRDLKVAAVDGLFLKVTLETRGPVLPEGDPGLTGLAYRVYLDAKKPVGNSEGKSGTRVVWTVRAFGRPGPDGARNSRYIAFGPGVSREVKTGGNTISIEGPLPPAFKNARQIYVSADVVASGSPAAVTGVAAQPVLLSRYPNP